jgi:hypothetical protein
MGGLLGSKKSQSQQTPAAAGLQAQTSAYGKVLPVVFGTTKIAPNMLWYGDFHATAQSSSGGGGKGGVGGGGGGKGGGGGSQYVYDVAVQMGLCEGPVESIGVVYKDKNQTTTADLGMSVFLGSYPQDPWDYMVSNHGKVTQTLTVPSVSPYKIILSDASHFIEDFGVIGPPSVTTFARVYSAPSSGQYLVTGNGKISLTYTFNSANAGEAVVIKGFDGYNRTKTTEASIPNTAPYTITVAAQEGYPLQDQGVTATNIGYIPVVGAPAAGQYNVAAGVYTFNSAQAGASVQISYGATNSTPPFEAIGYSGIVHCDVASYQLGNSPQMSNHNFEVFGFYSDSLAGSQDADASLVVQGIASAPTYGIGFPSAKWGDLTNYQDYTLACGLLISAAYTDQAATNQQLEDIALATNSEFVWSSSKLQLIPYGDTAITGNGHTYTPPAIQFDIELDDLIWEEGEDPVKLERANVSDSINSIKLEVYDRTNQYSTAVVEAKDQSAIDLYGLRQNSTTSTHLFTDVSVGTLSANLQLQRMQIQNYYTFTLDERFIMLDPMDLITLPMPDGSRQAVRIKEITENEDGSLSMRAEDYLAGIGTGAATYAFQRWGGFSVNYNASPGEVNTPVIFEPTAQLANGLEAWIAVSGVQENWGGSDVYISNDGNTYAWAGRISGPARMGVTLDAFPSQAEEPTGPTIDSVSVVGVDLSMSGGQLLPASQAEALQLATLFWVDGEFMAYQNAELLSSTSYDLSYFVRGAYESDITAHAAGAPFVRCDDGVLQLPYSADRVGQVVYIKFLSFNIYGGGQPTLDSVEPVTYTFQGTAYRSPLPDVTNLRQVFVAGIAQIVWDEVTDFRNPVYEIRKGIAAESGQILGRYAHPPFNLIGNDTYWVSAYAQPIPGIQVYSENWAGVSIQGATLTSNVIEDWDEKATGWSGTCSGYAAVVGDEVITTGSGDFLLIPDFLAITDFLWYGGQGSGTYTIPTGHQVQITTPTACLLLISWEAYGQHPNNDFLNYADFLAVTDFLDLGCSVNIDVYPEIRMSQNGGAAWGDWQKYVAGQYVGDKFDARCQLITYDSTVQAHLSEFFFSVDVPDRVDHYTNIALLAGGSTVTFQPDYASSPAPFNGGPGGAIVPNIQVTILGATAGDDVVVSGVSLSGCTVQVVNGGVGVVRNVSVVAQGY